MWASVFSADGSHPPDGPHPPWIPRRPRRRRRPSRFGLFCVLCCSVRAVLFCACCTSCVCYAVGAVTAVLCPLLCLWAGLHEQSRSRSTCRKRQQKPIWGYWDMGRRYGLIWAGSRWAHKTRSCNGLVMDLQRAYNGLVTGL